MEVRIQDLAVPAAGEMPVFLRAILPAIADRDLPDFVRWLLDLQVPRTFAVAKMVDADFQRRQASALDMDGFDDRRDATLVAYLRAMALERSGSNEAALNAWQQAADRQPSPEMGPYLALARLRRAGGNYAAAWDALQTAAEFAEGRTEHEQVGRLAVRLARQSTPEDADPIKLAYLSSSTTQLHVPVLMSVAWRDRIYLDMYTGGHGAWQQEILDPGSGLHRFAPAVVVIATHWRDAGLAPGEVASSAARPAHADIVQRFCGLWETLSMAHGCGIIQHGFDLPAHDPDGGLSGAHSHGLTRQLRALNEGLRDAAVAVPGVTILDQEALLAEVGAARWSGARYWHSLRQHPGPEAMGVLAEAQAAVIRALSGKVKKVLVLDLDNTLWGGVIGEDGLAGIDYGPPSAAGEAFQEFQRYVVALKKRGILLAVCSKNNDADARLPFHEREMALQIEDFVAFKASWREKPEVIREIAQELNVGLDSLVFVDDNPLERAKVRRILPAVTVIDLPPEPEHYIAALHRPRAFEVLSVSTEDMGRHQSYRANSARQEARSQAASLDDFLRSLDMRTTIEPVCARNIDRVAQLVGKTNQFNLTTRRHTKAELAAWAEASDWETWAYSLADAHGDFGIVGVALLHQVNAPEPVLEIETWLMSCRVFGRGLEHLMMRSFCDAAKRRGVTKLRGLFVPTAKNKPVDGIFARYGFGKATVIDGVHGVTQSTDAIQIPETFIRILPSGATDDRA